MTIFEKITRSFSGRGSGSKKKKNARPFAMTTLVGKVRQALGSTNEDYVTEGFEANDMLYSVVHAILDSMASLPVKVVDSRTGEEVSRDDALARMLNTPSYQHKSWEEFVRAVGGNLLVFGNAYLQRLYPKQGRNANKTQELLVLPTPEIMPVVSFEHHDLVPKIIGFKYIGAGDSVAYTYSDKDIIHIKTANLSWDTQGGSVLGMSPLKPARNLITQANDLRIASSHLLQNNGAIGILTTTGDAQLDEEAATALKEKYKENYQGPYNYGELIISTDPMNWVNMGMTPKDLALTEQETMTLRALCRLYNVPSQLFGDVQASTYSNYKEARRAYILQCVIPRLETILSSLNEILEKEYKQRVVIDTPNIGELQEDRISLIKALSGADFLTDDEKRELTGYGDTSNLG